MKLLFTKIIICTIVTRRLLLVAAYPLFSVHQSRQFQTQQATMRDRIIAFLLVFLAPVCSFCCARAVG